MKKVELIMPKMGESVAEATILAWLKKPGEKVEQDESILEVATDKVDTEIPSSYEGTLVEVLAQSGDVVLVGSPIAIIAVKDTTSTTVSPSTPKESGNSSPQTVESKEKNTPDRSPANPFKSSTRFYSPLVRTMAKAKDIALDELEKVPGTGNGGRVTKRDMLTYLEQRNGKKSLSEAVQPVTTTPATPVHIEPQDEIVQMDRMRKIIAARMVHSKHIAPHVTSFVEADVTALVAWRERKKEQFRRQEKYPLTYTPVFVEALVKALRDFPMMNIQVDGDRIIKKKDINIGIAVALKSGNLIVPVVKNADQQNLMGLVRGVNDLIQKAREKELTPDNLAGGTFTLSNVGSFGNVMGTPIILQPQVGIIATGVINKKPSVIETPHGDTIGIRHKLFLSHSYDHRVVDGALGGMFVRRVADYLEKFDVTQTL